MTGDRLSSGPHLRPGSRDVTQGVGPHTSPLQVTLYTYTSQRPHSRQMSIQVDHEPDLAVWGTSREQAAGGPNTVGTQIQPGGLPFDERSGTLLDRPFPDRREPFPRGGLIGIRSRGGPGDFDRPGGLEPPINVTRRTMMAIASRERDRPGRYVSC